MKLLKRHPFLGIVNSYIIDSPQPANISYLWNFGSLLALCLGIQIATGVVLAMHYVANVDLAFISVEHIMRDVNYGWLIRYLHSNVASFFFLFVYMHMARGLYYGSYKEPRTLVWSIGVVIFLVMIITAFLGYVLPFGQMSLWGIFMCPKWVEFLNKGSNVYIYSLTIPFLLPKTRSRKRIGPHNYEILSILIGSLLGDTYAERHGHGTRFCFQQEHLNNRYLLWFSNYLNKLGYCTNTLPKITTRISKGGK